MSLPKRALAHLGQGGAAEANAGLERVVAL